MFICKRDDCCDDWYEDDYSSQFPRAEEETGWGIEETMYTSSLDKSKLSPEQIAMAERIANEIERESRSKVKSTNMGGVGGYMPPPAQTYAESQTSSFLAKQKATLPPRAQHEPMQEQHVPQQQQNLTPPHQQFTNECKVVKWLQEEMTRVLSLIGTRGEPRADQAGRLLVEYTSSVTTMIPYSPQEVKTSVVASFRKCNWDVLRRNPMPGQPPPSGKTLCDLIFELGIYFCQRTNQPGPPPGFVDMKLAEYRASASAVQQQQRPRVAPRQQTIPNMGGKGGKGKGKGDGKGGYHGKGDGKGYQGKGKGGEGKGYQGKGPRRDNGKGGKGPRRDTRT